MPQPFQTGIDRHQRCHDLHPVMTGTTGVHFPGDLVQVIAHAGKLTQQRRRNRGKLPARVGFSSRQVWRIHAASCFPSQRSSNRRCSSSVTHIVSILLRLSARIAS
jgi:hypothetical protein